MSNIIGPAREDRIDFGDGPLAPEERGRAFVVSYAPDGSFRWYRPFSRGMPVAGFVDDRDLAVGTRCVAVVGSFQDTVDFGTGPRTANGLDDSFIVCLDPETGETRWDHHIGGPLVDRALWVSVDDTGRVFVAGTFKGSVRIGSETYTAGSDDDQDTYLAVFSGTGELLWSRAYGVVGPMYLHPTPGDGAVLTLQVDEPVDAGGGLFEPVMHDVDQLLVAYGPDGEFRWQVPLTGAGRAGVTATTTLPGGGLLVSGEFRDDLQVGRFSLHDPDPGGPSHRPGRGFLARLGPDGTVLGLERQPWPASGLGFQDDGSLIIGGSFHREASYGGCTITEELRPEHGHDAMYDGFVVSLAPDGSCEWILQLASSVYVPPCCYVDVDYVAELVLDPSGAPVFVGRFNESLSIGDTTLSAEVPISIYVAKLAAD